LVAGLNGVQTMDFEAMTVRHLGGLMLARMDGKSPVEYIREEGVKSRVRRAAVRLLKEQPGEIEAALELVKQSIDGT
jgi:hypothetical protein